MVLLDSAGMVALLDVLSALLKCSEKSAVIARKIREQEALFQLLIEVVKEIVTNMEKMGSCKNTKFAQDFKTLADVIIQETVRHDLAKHFVPLANNISGEESNAFCNALKECIEVKVCSTVKETASLLARVLNDDDGVATILAEAVHSEVDLSEDLMKDLTMQLEGVEMSTELENLGIWIDPIDSTSSYIASSAINKEVDGWHQFVPQGLQVVTVLIGVYDMRSGKPLIGVVNQPFSKLDPETQTWKGTLGWGINLSPQQQYISSSLQKSSRVTSLTVVTGKADEPKVQKLVKANSDVNFVTAAGAGYKMLSVIRGWSDVYVAVGGNTYKWDTCAGHAIVEAMGGGVVEFAKNRTQLTYNEDSSEEDNGVERFSNSNGFIAFIKSEKKDALLNFIEEDV